MKLLIETRDCNEVQTLIENSNDKKSYFIEGVFLQADIKNRNGRMYPKKIMKTEVDRYTKTFIESNRALGELGHPTNPSVNLERVSHKIISLKEDGNNIIGRAKILDTPFGIIVKNLMDEGVKLGVSSRGLGSLKEEKGIKVVCDDFELVTAADIVADPSAPDAFVTNLMENKEWIWENGKLVEHEVEIKQIINTVLQSNEEKMIKIFEHILSKL